MLKDRIGKLERQLLDQEEEVGRHKSLLAQERLQAEEQLMIAKQRAKTEEVIADKFCKTQPLLFQMDNTFFCCNRMVISPFKFFYICSYFCIKTQLFHLLTEISLHIYAKLHVTDC